MTQTGGTLQAPAAAQGVVEAQEIPVHLTAAPRGRPSPSDDLGFGRYFTDHVFRVDYDSEAGWTDPRVEPYAPFSIDPAAAVLHYAQAIFDGLKAFRGADGRVRGFRVIDSARRFARSAEGMAMPPLDPALFVDGVEAVIRTDADWVPSVRGSALYIRPVMFATEAFLGVRPAERYTCMVVLSPVGSYYGGKGLRAVRLWVEERRVRAAPGGIGEFKAAANYAASLGAGLDSKRRGYDQVLWLDAVNHRQLEEAGTMNVFVRIGEEIITPPLGGTILPGITRNSVLSLLRRWNMNVSERNITIDEVRAAHQRGELAEVFGVGTAAVISPVGVLGFADGDLVVGTGDTGTLARRLYEAVTAIQYGEAEDPEGWTTLITLAAPNVSHSPAY